MSGRLEGCGCLFVLASNLPSFDTKPLFIFGHANELAILKTVHILQQQPLAALTISIVPRLASQPPHTNTIPTLLQQ